MVPDAATIARRRHLLRTIIRCAALGLLLLFGAQVVVAVVIGLLENMFLGASFFGRVLAGAWPVFAGLALLLFEKRLVVWLVPIGSQRCPQCDYFLVSLVEPKCPECGLPLTREFMDPGVPTGRR
jgi:hypothetical protein